MSFNDDIKGFNKNFNEAYIKIFRGTALSILGKIIIRTPVKTGRLRGNWFSSINRPVTKIDGGGEGFESTVSRAKIGDVIYMVNNLPYAKAIEDGHGANNRPGGMVKVTVEEFQHIVAKNARKNKV